MSIILTIIKVIFVLGFLVLIHEAGHFFVAKKCGIKVNEFAIGFGPKIWSKQGKETLYAIRLIPLGGFVNMEGEEEHSDDENSFSNKSPAKRIAVVAAGASVNILFAIVTYFILVMAVGEFQTTTISEISAQVALNGLQVNDEIVKINDKKIRRVSDINDILEECNGETLNFTVKRDGEKIENIMVSPTEVNARLIGIVFMVDETEYANEVSYVQANSPAALAGIKEGDIISKINGEETPTPQDVIDKIASESTDEKVITILRDDEEIQVNVVPENSTYYVVDFDLAMLENNFLKKAYYSIFSVGDFISSAVDSVKMIFTGQVKADQLTGPIGIGKIVSETHEIQDFIELLILISLSLGVTNLLPFPPLDGGKIVFILIEAIRKKPVRENLEIAIQMAGFVVLICLSVYIGYKDVLKII